MKYRHSLYEILIDLLSAIFFIGFIITALVLATPEGYTAECKSGYTYNKDYIGAEK